MIYLQADLLQEVAITSPVTCASAYAPKLRTLGFRVTSQRMAILHVLRHSRGHLSPVDVYTRARKSVPGITQPTVYRTLEFLADNGLVWQTNLTNGHLAYELAEEVHSHLVCRQCGRELQISPALLDRMYQDLGAISGYAVDHKHLSISGLCPKCRKRRATTDGKRHEGHPS